jgi:hypothetical protein
MAAPVPTDWAVLVFTTLAAGALGSTITAYGGRASERRAASVEAGRRMQRAEVLSRQHDTEEARAEFESSLDELQAACLIMGPQVYQRAVLYRRVRMYHFGYRKMPRTAQTPPLAKAASGMAGFVAAFLLAESIRHPWLSMIARRQRVRVFRRYLQIVGEESTSDVQHQLYGHLRQWLADAAAYGTQHGPYQ